MKILDRYILFTFIKTFLSIFIILMFIFVLQSVWLYIQELAGRDLDGAVIFKFLLFVTPSLVTLVLPLSVLLTSIMTFGNFAENYEFAAMKSTGISLQRAMKSLIFFITALGIISFLFANYVIPASQYEFRNLRRNIAKVKPAMVIRKGQFNTIGEDINIKIADKYGDRDQYLTDVTIHQKDPKRIGNYTVIKAKEGELISSEDSPVLALQLKDGNYYSEVYQSDIKKRKREPFAKSYFETYTINIDLSSLDDVDLDKRDIGNSHQMLNVVELDSSLTYLSEKFNTDRENFANTFIGKGNFTPLKGEFKTTENDTVKEELLENYKLRERLQILELARSNIKNSITTLGHRKKTLSQDIKRINKFEISLHDKYVLGLSCIILFFVGAPLGAIIRKGGLGLPIVTGVVLFLTFHFVGIFTKNSAEDGTLSAFTASWFSSFIMLPLGVYLTYRATTDQGIFNLDGFIEPIKRLFSKKKEEAAPLKKEKITLLPEEKNILEGRTIVQLKEIVRNYKQFNYSENVRSAAILKLEESGISQEQLIAESNFENDVFNEAERSYKAYITSSKRAFLLYFVTVITNIPFLLLLVIPLSEFLINVIVISKYIGLITSLMYLIFFIKSFFNYHRFYTVLNKKNGAESTVVLYILGIAFYFITFFYFKKKMKEDLSFAS